MGGCRPCCTVHSTGWSCSSQIEVRCTTKGIRQLPATSPLLYYWGARLPASCHIRRASSEGMSAEPRGKTWWRYDKGGSLTIVWSKSGRPRQIPEVKSLGATSWSGKTSWWCRGNKRCGCEHSWLCARKGWRTFPRLRDETEKKCFSESDTVFRLYCLEFQTRKICFCAPTFCKILHAAWHDMSTPSWTRIPSRLLWDQGS